MSRGEWTVETVAGHPVEIYTPPTRDPRGRVVVYLHGVHQNRLNDHPAFTDLFDRHGLVCVNPRSMRSWWVDRVCPEFDAKLTPEKFVVEHVAGLLRDRYGADASKTLLLGASMGGQGALRISYRHPTKFPTVAAISPAIDFHKRFYEGDELPAMFDDPESARQETAILHIHPLNWPRHQFFCCDPSDDRWWDGADRLRMKLYSLGVPHECDLETTGGGHSFEYYARMADRAIGFLVERSGGAA